MLRQWDDLAVAKSYLTGGVGSRHYDEGIGDAHELPLDRAYCETCASIASIMWQWRMLLVTGESRFADQLERTLYNGFLSGLSLDGGSFFYTNPLQSRNGKRRHPWDPVACCPPNIMRLLASVHHYLATTSARGSSSFTSTRPRRSAHSFPVWARSNWRWTIDYPWSGSVTIEIVKGGDAELDAVLLRVPAWARSATIDGQRRRRRATSSLARHWRAGERVVVEPRHGTSALTAPNPRIDAVRGCLAIERGPIVYCLEALDLAAGVDLADVAVDANGRASIDSGPILAAGRLEPGVAFTGVVHNLDGWHQTEYRDVRELREVSVSRRRRRCSRCPTSRGANRGPVRYARLDPGGRLTMAKLALEQITKGLRERRGSRAHARPRRSTRASVRRARRPSVRLRQDDRAPQGNT